MQVLKVILYILAGLILLLGLYAGISLMVSASHTIANILMPFQLFGNQTISNALAPTLSAFFINLGVIIILMAVILSSMLFGLARLINHILNLETRLARLEARSQ